MSPIFRPIRRPELSSTELAQLTALKGKTVGDLSVEDLRLLITSLPKREESMRKEMDLGVDFLLATLNEFKSPKEFILFVERLTEILDKSGKFLDYDLTESEQKRLGLNLSKMILPRSPTLSRFLRTNGWTIPGAIGFMYSLAKISHCDDLAEYIANHLVQPAELLLGVALVNEGAEHYRIERLEHVANAIDELAQRLKKDHTNNR